MIFEVRDLMIDVFPGNWTKLDDLLMCTGQTTTGEPKPPPPPPKPKPGKVFEESAGGEVLAQLHEQLHAALGA